MCVLSLWVKPIPRLETQFGKLWLCWPQRPLPLAAWAESDPLFFAVNAGRGTAPSFPCKAAWGGWKESSPGCSSPLWISMGTPLSFQTRPPSLRTPCPVCCAVCRIQHPEVNSCEQENASELLEKLTPCSDSHGSMWVQWCGFPSYVELGGLCQCRAGCPRLLSLLNSCLKGYAGGRSTYCLTS